MPGCLAIPEIAERETQSDPIAESYWEIIQLQDKDNFWIIEASGSYRQIGRSLGSWYQSQGSTPKHLSEEERQKALSLQEFYQDVNPEINNQIRGVYDYFGLDYLALTDGVPLSNNQGLEVLLPGLISSHSCSIVFAGPELTTDRQALLGRNYDFPDEVDGFTLMFTSPKEGYTTAVITTMTPGFSAADGINSEGLALGFASVIDLGYQPAAEDTLISGYFYRYILEQSRNVEEAINLLETIPISFLPSNPPGIITHILLADRSGTSAVIEFIPEGIVVSRSGEPYQILTNNLWYDPEIRSSCERYAKAEVFLEETGLIDSEMMMALLGELRGSTQYSVVYNLDSLDLILSTKEDGFSSIYSFSLQDFIESVGAR